MTGLMLCAAVCALLLHRRAAERELVARACHELRAPLAAAHLAVDALAREPAVRADRLAALDGALHSARRALADLDAARTGRVLPTRSRRVDLAGVLEAAAPGWRLTAAAAGRRLRVDAEPRARVEGDPDRLLQAATNLVRNAVEHGRGDVRVVARVAADRVRLEVRDDGPGLPAVTRRARAGHGTRGRGLAIAGGIAAAHAGRLAAEPGAVVLEFPRAGR